MSTSFKRLLNYAVGLLAVVIVGLISISIFAILNLTTQKLIDLVTLGEMDFSYLALVIISALIASAGLWCYSHWKYRRTFLYVSIDHHEVVPVDRREEYFDLGL